MHKLKCGLVRLWVEIVGPPYEWMLALPLHAS